MSSNRDDAKLGRNRTHRWANLIVGLHTPRAWWRKLSPGKFVKAVAYVRNIWLLANDNNVCRMDRPRWFPKWYIWGKR